MFASNDYKRPLLRALSNAQGPAPGGLELVVLGTGRPVVGKAKFPKRAAITFSFA